jgi:DNA-binding beta-propeller fold protein YncE
MQMPRYLTLLLGLCLAALPAGAAQPPSFLSFESGPVRPLALSPDGTKLFVANTPDNQLEVFDVDAVTGLLTRAGTVQVGMEPVAVAARSNDEVWVVNHLSDSVSVVLLDGGVPRVSRTLHVGDEPNDIVFAGPQDLDGFHTRAFVSAAHRGQNTPHPQGDYATPGIGRADVWVFDTTALGGSLGGDEIAILGLFGDKPRALAVDPGGTTVYAAVFRSGNQTTAVSEGLVCDTDPANVSSDTLQPACVINGANVPGGSPPPHSDHSAVPRPETGMILKFNRDGGTLNQWQDEIAGRNWNDVVKFDLPDRDVFAIDAIGSAPDFLPAAVDASSSCANGAGCWAGVGTILFNMVVNPSSGKIYVSNTEAQNHVRFEGPGTHATGKKPLDEPTTVQGNLAQARITVLDGASVTPRHLNSHLDYSVRPAPPGDKDKSLATPLEMAVTPDGTTLYVAAFGSQKIGILDTAELEAGTFVPNTTDRIALGGGGPAGLVLRGDKLYVLTRFDNSLRVIDRIAKLQDEAWPLHNPEPPEVVDGRPFLYDANLTSSNGEASCASCHIFGDMDDLGWDLGDPDGDVAVNNNPFNPVIPAAFDPLCFPNGNPACTRSFHSMKGPMTTQSLRGLANMGPEHWRGDRQGDEIAAFEAFNVAFPGLVGRTSQLTSTEMQAFRKFALELRYPPNPVRQLDNSMRPDELAGFSIYTGPVTDGVSNCVGCHSIDPANGHFGGDGQSTFEGETQHFKIPHLRNVYQKIGMFGMAEPEAPGGAGLAGFDPPFTHQGPQVRGFGMSHDGSIDTLFRFVSAGLFSVDATQQAQLEAFMMAFPSDLAPIVGQQVTLTSGNGAVANPRIDLMIARATLPFVSKILDATVGDPVTECDLIAKVVEGGVQRGYLYQGDATLLPDDSYGGGATFLPDDGGPAIDDNTLRGKPTPTGQEVTFTCAPPGSGERMGRDRDLDQLLDGVETDTGTFVSASDTGTNPALADTDGDGFDDGAEVTAGTDPTNPFSFPGAPAVPLLSPLGLMGLAAGLGLVAGRALRRRAAGAGPRP